MDRPANFVNARRKIKELWGPISRSGIDAVLDLNGYHEIEGDDKYEYFPKILIFGWAPEDGDDRQLAGIVWDDDSIYTYDGKIYGRYVIVQAHNMGNVMDRFESKTNVLNFIKWWVAEDRDGLEDIEEF